MLAVARRYQSQPVIDRAFGQARALIARELREQELTTQDLRSLDGLLSALVYPNAGLRAPAETLASNRKGQHGLWGFGISGDHPILLVRLKSEEETSLVRDVLRAHAYWRRRGIKVDVVIRVEKESGYGRELQGELYRLLVRMGSDPYLNQRGGIYLVSSDQMAGEDRVLLETAARVILDGSRGTLAAQLGEPAAEPIRLPAFVPTLSQPEDVEPTIDLPRPTDLQHDNGLGGFSPDGGEYQIYLTPGDRTPRPWINVIANPRFGFTVSEAGAGSTWAGNSSENRLTPWSNDPVSDPPGEALYLRDEETALIWSPTPQPAPAAAPYLIRHGAGYSVFEHHSHGLRQQLLLFAAAESPVKVIVLRLENGWQRSRRLTATYYVPWALGTSREATAPTIVSEYEPEVRALLAHNPYSAEFAGGYAFLAASQPPHGVTADRTEFLGRMGDPSRPAALGRVGLEGTVRAGLDPCAAIQLHVELEAGQAKEIYFLLGQGADREKRPCAWRALGSAGGDASSLARSACGLGGTTWYGEGQHARSGDGCDAQPLAALPGLGVPDVGPHGLLSIERCVRLSRSAAGRHGPRARCARTWRASTSCWRRTISSRKAMCCTGGIRPSGAACARGSPTICCGFRSSSAHYVAATGDESILDETGAVLASTVCGRKRTNATACSPRLRRHIRCTNTAAERWSGAATRGAHGLPLMGRGDWNDGMNRVGAGGQGESVWLGWFLHATLSRFAAIERAPRSGRRGGGATGQRAESLRQALESAGWDGAWYRRAYYDDGEPLGAAGRTTNAGSTSMAQSWAVLSGAGDPARAAQAMRAVIGAAGAAARTASCCSLTPPFDQTTRDPGYIKGYPAGHPRERRRQYTHAAIWVAWACADLGWATMPTACSACSTRSIRADTPEKVARYAVEPYVVAADISGQASRTSGAGAGRGTPARPPGCTGWGSNACSACSGKGAALVIDPCIPASWPGYRIEYRYGGSTYAIEVDNPDSVSHGVRDLQLDGALLPDGRIPLSTTGRPTTCACGWAEAPTSVEVAGGSGRGSARTRRLAVEWLTKDLLCPVFGS